MRKERSYEVHSRKTKCKSCGNFMVIGEKKLYCPDCDLVKFLAKNRKLWDKTLK
jgi:hypothetical protein